MGLLQSQKNPSLRIWKSTALVLAGVLIGVVGVLAIVVQHQPSQADLNDTKLQYTVNYVKSEQARLGIDCQALRKDIQSFLIKDVKPALRANQPGRHWIDNFSQDSRRRMGELRDTYFVCGNLYHMAKNVQWDGFNDMGYIEKMDSEIITLNTLIRFGGPGDDRGLHEMQEAVNTIEHMLDGRKSE